MHHLGPAPPRQTRRVGSLRREESPRHAHLQGQPFFLRSLIIIIIIPLLILFNFHVNSRLKERLQELISLEE